MTGTIWDLFILLVKVVGVFAFLMVSVLFIIWLERKVVAWMQTRVGPNRVGPMGLLQSLADGIKLFFKEDIRPASADRILYPLAPVVMAVPAFLAVSVIPFGTSFGSQKAQLTDLDVGLLFVLAMGSLQVYGIVLAGFAAGSNYPLLGGVRSSAQMISYELAQGLSLVGVFMLSGTLSAAGIVAAQKGVAHLNVGDASIPVFPNWYILPQLPMFLVFLLAGIAETNRAPFDLPEAETELVGGYHTEYSGVKFALFFLAEYVNIITVSAVAATLFLGGPDGPVLHGFLPWLWPILWFIAKVYLFIFLFIWLRATLPRLRFDRLMAIGWKVLIPVAL
ncbi:MAG: NADH-quinone oxidoreductase subunit NuoH, partial [Sporichthyaceae bacterium]|nr:NADH-quinone oxidoreductase subunit NuoH [Sporichthyaceae bacterium]